MSDLPVRQPSRPVEGVVDRYLQRRAAARALAARSARESPLTSDFATSMAELGELKDLRYTMDFGGQSASFEDQARVAAQALQLGVSRSVSLAYTGGISGFGWDTHADNDAQQASLYEGLFSGLLALMATLQATPGRVAATLAEETTVVVLSEMGRTPALNPVLGKDHWPYTSVMMIGPHVTGDRVVGGFDEAFYGQPVDPGTGEVDPAGPVLSAEAVGATLLALADVDPEPYVSGVEPIRGVIA